MDCFQVVWRTWLYTDKEGVVSVRGGEGIFIILFSLVFFCPFSDFVNSSKCVDRSIKTLA